MEMWKAYSSVNKLSRWDFAMFILCICTYHSMRTRIRASAVTRIDAMLLSLGIEGFVGSMIACLCGSIHIHPISQHIMWQLWSIAKKVYIKLYDPPKHYPSTKCMENDMLYPFIFRLYTQIQHNNIPWSWGVKISINFHVYIIPSQLNVRIQHA